LRRASQCARHSTGSLRDEVCRVRGVPCPRCAVSEVSRVRGVPLVADVLKVCGGRLRRCPLQEVYSGRCVRGLPPVRGCNAVHRVTLGLAQCVNVSRPKVMVGSVSPALRSVTSLDPRGNYESVRKLFLCRTASWALPLRSRCALARCALARLAALSLGSLRSFSLRSFSLRCRCALARPRRAVAALSLGSLRSLSLDSFSLRCRCALGPRCAMECAMVPVRRCVTGCAMD